MLHRYLVLKLRNESPLNVMPNSAFQRPGFARRSRHSLETGRRKGVSMFRVAGIVAGLPAATEGTYTASYIPPQVKRVTAFIFGGNS